MKCERGLLERADGSARWSQDGSSCLVGVYGPRQTQVYREDAEQTIIIVQYKPRTGIPGIACKAIACMEATLRSMERWPVIWHRNCSFHHKLICPFLKAYTTLPKFLTVKSTGWEILLETTGCKSILIMTRMQAKAILQQPEITHHFYSPQDGCHSICKSHCIEDFIFDPCRPATTSLWADLAANSRRCGA